MSPAPYSKLPALTASRRVSLQLLSYSYPPPFVFQLEYAFLMQIWACPPIPGALQQAFKHLCNHPQIFSKTSNALHGLTPSHSAVSLDLTHSFSVSHMPATSCHRLFSLPETPPPTVPLVNSYPSFIYYFNYAFLQKAFLDSPDKGKSPWDISSLSIMQLSSISYHSWIFYLLLWLLLVSG